MITAVLKKKKLKTNWGFKFDTDIQSYVENFMLSIHVGSSDYYLCFTEEAPDGVYSEVKVAPYTNEKGELLKVGFLLT